MLVRSIRGNWIISTNNLNTDKNECEVNNGGCSYHVTCNNTAGGYFCPSCPSGYTGNSYNICERMPIILMFLELIYSFYFTALCGNKQCDIGYSDTYSENCVNCPLDCRESFCSKIFKKKKKLFLY